MAKLAMLKNIQSSTGTQDSRSVSLTVKDIPIGDICIKENVRTEYTGIDELAESIRQCGLLQPITVYLEDGCYVVKTGHRRFMAYRKLYQITPEQFHSIRSIISDPHNTVLIQLVENVQRVDLSQIDLWNALNEMKSQGMTLKQIAEVMGKTEGYIKSLFVGVNELNRDQDLSGLLGDAGITIRDIAETKAIPDKEKRLALHEERKSGNISRAKMREKTKELTGTSSKDEILDIPEEQEKQNKIHVSIKAFPSLSKIIIYHVKGGNDGQLASIENDIRGYFTANREKYRLEKTKEQTLIGSDIADKEESE